MSSAEELSREYEIPRETIEILLSEDEKRFELQRDTGLVEKFLVKNSQNLQKYLASLPAPTRKVSFAISVDFLLPTGEAMGQFLNSDTYPTKYFRDKNEIATKFYDERGVDFYVGDITQNEEKETVPLLPDYVNVVGHGRLGVEKVVRELWPTLVENNFFVYQMKLGIALDLRKSVEVTHNNVGVGKWSLLFGYYGGRYDWSSQLSHQYLGNYWDPKTSKKIAASAKSFDENLFKFPKREFPLEKTSAALFFGLGKQNPLTKNRKSARLRKST